MNDIPYPPALDYMLAAWNESDQEKIRAHLDKALTKDVHFIDPSITTLGINAFEQNVREVQKRLPGAVYSRVSALDSHNELYRYHWAIHVNGELAIQGFDVTEIRDDKVSKVIGFFGALPLNREI